MRPAEVSHWVGKSLLYDLADAVGSGSELVLWHTGMLGSIEITFSAFNAAPVDCANIPQSVVDCWMSCTRVSSSVEFFFDQYMRSVSLTYITAAMIKSLAM